MSILNLLLIFVIIAVAVIFIMRHISSKKTAEVVQEIKRLYETIQLKLSMR